MNDFTELLKLLAILVALALFFSWMIEKDDR
jgi:hypothetical protein